MRTRVLRSIVLLLALALPPTSSAEPTRSPPPIPDRAQVEEELPEGSELTGREIYERFLKNRYRRSEQKLRIVSKDPGGSAQTTMFEAQLEDYRDDEERAVDGVRAKLFIEITSPFDVRHTRYLIIARDPGPDDEWIYQPSERRVRRARLKRTPLMGTDYTFDDVAYHDIEQADYVRRADSVIDGVSVYVVEATVKETRDVEYHKTVSYIEKEHYVPLRTRYWDEYGVELRQMNAKHESIKAFGEEMWIATESSMTNLLQSTTSLLYVEELDTDPVFHEKVFGLARMTKGL